MASKERFPQKTPRYDILSTDTSRDKRAQSAGSKSPVKMLRALAAETASAMRKLSRMGRRRAKPTAKPATMLSPQPTVFRGVIFGGFQ